MGFLDGLFNPSKNTKRAYRGAIRDWRSGMGQTNPFYQSFIDQGLNANNMLARYLGLMGPDAQRQAYQDFITSPGYEANMRAGTRAIDQSGAARGMSQSGSALKALQQYGQDLYSQELNGYLNRLSGQGQQGFAGAQGLMGNYGQLGQLRIGRGQAADAGNQAAAGNILQIGSTIAGMAMGIPPGMMGGGGFGSMMGGSNMPTQIAPQGRFLGGGWNNNPYGAGTTGSGFGAFY